MKKTLKHTLASIVAAAMILSATVVPTTLPSIGYNSMIISAVDINDYNKVRYSDEYGEWMFYLTTSSQASKVEVTLGDFTPKANVTTVAIPSKVTAKGKDFNNKEFTVNATVTGIYVSAMSNLTKLKRITIPSSVTTIGADAFKGCTSLDRVYLYPYVTTIGGNAFEGCTSLKTINIPSSVTFIGNAAFKGCTALTQISLPRLVDHLGYVFEGCTSLTSVDVDIDVLSKSDATFKGCEKLETINGEKIIINNQVNPKIQKAFSRYNYGDLSILDSAMIDTIKKIAEEETKDCSNDLEIAKALHDWICKKVSYDHKEIWDPKNHTDYSVFLNDKTVCDGYARAFALLMQAVKTETIETYYVTGNYEYAEEYGRRINHAWNVVKIGDTYYHVDCCWDDNDNPNNPYDYDNFLFSDQKAKTMKYHKETNIVYPSALYQKYDGKKTVVCDVTIGDATGDAVAANDDYEVLKLYISKKIELNDKQIKNLDINFDGKTDLTDLTHYASYIISPSRLSLMTYICTEMEK